MPSESNAILRHNTNIKYPRVPGDLYFAVFIIGVPIISTKHLLLNCNFCKFLTIHGQQATRDRPS